jgi:hypothetical protein
MVVLLVDSIRFLEYGWLKCFSGLRGFAEPVTPRRPGPKLLPVPRGEDFSWIGSPRTIPLIGHPPRTTTDGTCPYPLGSITRFKKGVQLSAVRIPQYVHHPLTPNATDPTVRDLRAGRIKSGAITLCIRIGVSLRMLYRVYSQARRVERSRIRTPVYISDRANNATSQNADEVHAQSIRRYPRSTASQPISVAFAVSAACSAPFRCAEVNQLRFRVRHERKF